MSNENPKQALMKLVEEWESQDKQAFIEELLDLLTDEQIQEILDRHAELKEHQKVVWVAESVFCSASGHLLIQKGEVRKIIGLCEDGKLWLSGHNGKGCFGAVDPKCVAPTDAPVE